MKLTMLLSLLIFTYLSHAQDDDISRIRVQYIEINKMIKECAENECGLYQNSLVINNLNGAWRGSGNYTKVIKFWYNDDPSHCDECGQNGINVLQKIEIEETSSLYQYHYELLFNEGELVFYYQTGGESDDSFRYYFKENRLIRYMKNQTVIQEHISEHSHQLQKAESLQSLFLLSFK